MALRCIYRWTPRGTLNSRLDATWQERLLGIEEIELETIWAEMDKIMKALHPTHIRRMKFLNHETNQTSSSG